MHEIITLQLGQRANYLATHFWNTQESYFTYSSDEQSLMDHDVHFRPGLGVDSTETFTPRTLIYDLKSGFGSLRKLNALYDATGPEAPQALWHGSTVIKQQPTIEQHPYQQSLDRGSTPPQLTPDSIRYWSDFNRVYYHPRSLIHLNEYELNSTIMPFETWAAGEELFKSIDKELDVLDTDLRPFIEEADQLQGFNIISSNDDAWAGFAARYMDRLRDEFSKSAVWFWGLQEGTQAVPPEKRLPRLLNTARSIAEIAPQASMYVPMSLPPRLPSYVDLISTSPWHAYGLLSTAFESVTLPSRLKRASGILERLDHIEASLNISGHQNIVKLQMSTGHRETDAAKDARSNGLNHNPLENAGALGHGLENSMDAHNNDGFANFDLDFSPEMFEDGDRSRREYQKSHVFGRFECDRSTTGGSIQSVNDDEQQARRRAAGQTVSRRLEVPIPFPLLDSFPHIYTEASSDSILVRTALETTSAIGAGIKGLRRTINRVAPLEDREVLSSTLGDIAEQYQEGWESGSDEDDD